MIKYSHKNGTAFIMLNRPEKRNSLHPELVEQLKQKLYEAENDNIIKSIIISGEGKSFCAGADLSYLNDLRSFSSIENEKDSSLLADLFLQIYHYPKPVIAAVNGAAIAGGCGLASVCDFIIAHPENSKFGYSEVKIGFLPAIVSIFLIKRIGEGSAKQLLLSGEIIKGERAYQLGFVNYLSEDVLKEAESLAEKLNSSSSSSLKMTKQMINNISGLSVDEAVKYCIRLNALSRTTQDFKNGLENFLKKD